MPSDGQKLSADEKTGLELIREVDGIHQSEFWKKLDVSSRKGSRIIDSLAEKGYVDRKETEYEGHKTYFIETAEDPRKSGTHSGWVTNDVDTTDDALGFNPYVQVLKQFLLHDRTDPPITISIEGDWGAGKSSFMGMLREAIEEEDNDYYTVEFNPWRHDNEEGIWAAFMLEFFDAIESDLGTIDRLARKAVLRWRQGWRARIISFGPPLFVLVLPVLLPILWVVGPSLPWTNVVGIGLGLSAAAALITVWSWTKDVFLDPLEQTLESYVTEDDYVDRVSFIERFHDDFEEILNAYVGDDGIVFVFIDDLDRCLPERSAELIRSINLLLSKKDSRVFFVLGMDRAKVAAGIAASHRDLLPYYYAADSRDPKLAEERTDGRNRSLEDGYNSLPSYGLEFANNYLEKFIQIPFLIPKPREDDIGSLVRSLMSTADDGSEVSPGDEEAEADVTSTDEPKGNPIEEEEVLPPEKIEEIGRIVAPVFDYNPRRIKMFMNLFRLRTMLATEANLFASGDLTVEQLAKFVAISLEWPSVTARMGDANILEELNRYEPDDDEPPAVIADWTDEERQKLTTLLSEKDNDPAYQLLSVPEELFWISPRVDQPAEPQKQEPGS